MLDSQDLSEKTWLASLNEHPGYLVLLKLLNEAAEIQAETIEVETKPSELLMQVAEWKSFRRLVRILHAPAEMREHLSRLQDHLQTELNPLHDPLAPPVPSIQFNDPYFGN